MDTLDCLLVLVRNCFWWRLRVFNCPFFSDFDPISFTRIAHAYIPPPVMVFTGSYYFGVLVSQQRGKPCMEW